MKHDDRITCPGSGSKKGTHLGQYSSVSDVDVCALEATVGRKLPRPAMLVRKRRVERRLCIYQQNPLGLHVKLDSSFPLVITRVVQQLTDRDSERLRLSSLGRTEHFERDFAILSYLDFPCRTARATNRDCVRWNVFIH